MNSFKKFGRQFGGHIEMSSHKIQQWNSTTQQLEVAVLQNHVDDDVLPLSPAAAGGVL